MIKGAIFDADGTLLDSMEIWENVTPQYLEKRGHSLTSELAKKLATVSIEEGTKLIKDAYNLSETCEEIQNEILSSIENFYKNDVLLKPGVYKFLEDLYKKNVPMVVASAGNKELMEAAFSRLGISHFFKSIITCSQLKVNKSVPDIYLHAASILGTNINETMVFEDSLTAIKTAKNAGFLVCAIEDFSNKNDLDEIKKYCDVFVKDFHTLTKRCVIISAAPIKNYKKIKTFLDSQNNFYIFCDAGLCHQKKLKIKPDLIVGDFDSHKKPKTSIKTICLPCEKDDTDTFYALKHALSLGFINFLFIGAIGKRFDHSLCNISALLFAHNKGFSAQIIDDFSQMQIADSTPCFVEDTFSFFSLMIVDSSASKITIKDAKYPLENGTLCADYQYAISNEVLKNKTAQITVGEGKLLLVKVF